MQGFLTNNKKKAQPITGLFVPADPSMATQLMTIAGGSQVKAILAYCSKAVFQGGVTSDVKECVTQTWKGRHVACWYDERLQKRPKPFAHSAIHNERVLRTLGQTIYGDVLITGLFDPQKGEYTSYHGDAEGEEFQTTKQPTKVSYKKKNNNTSAPLYPIHYFYY